MPCWSSSPFRDPNNGFERLASEVCDEVFIFSHIRDTRPVSIGRHMIPIGLPRIIARQKVRNPYYIFLRPMPLLSGGALHHKCGEILVTCEGLRH